MPSSQRGHFLWLRTHGGLRTSRGWGAGTGGGGGGTPGASPQASGFALLRLHIPPAGLLSTGRKSAGHAHGTRWRGIVPKGSDWLPPGSMDPAWTRQEEEERRDGPGGLIPNDSPKGNRRCQRGSARAQHGPAPRRACPAQPLLPRSSTASLLGKPEPCRKCQYRAR